VPTPRRHFPACPRCHYRHPQPGERCTTVDNTPLIALNAGCLSSIIDEGAGRPSVRLFYRPWGAFDFLLDNDEDLRLYIVEDDDAPAP
jgi:hypothetical protein